jgi:serine/threonine protein kinase
MGIVYRAEQKEPVSRHVAIKVIKPGMDTLEVLKRFEAERQILALLDHPHIARILDGGITAHGRPYFVMDLAEGYSLTDHLRDQPRPLNEKITLFLKICQAVIHAHQRGIIHRDLKPSNILMSGDDPKVIDFGIAKSLDLRVTEETLVTLPSRLLGTPAYMAPEQLDAQNPIDIRTDIYGLGALLYELLTHRPPFDPSRLKTASPTQLEEILTEEIPPRPSTLLPPKKLPKDLDWIVMHALEKDPARRYQTVNNLVSDLQSFLNDESINARPPSPAYRLAKFSKRHRLLLVSTGVIILTLLVATFLSLHQARQATLARNNMATVKNASQDLLGQVVTRLYPEARKTGNFAPLISSAKSIVNYLDEVPSIENDTPDNLIRRADGYWLAVKMLETAGDFPTARDAAKKCLKLREKIASRSPNTPWIRFHHGQALNGAGWTEIKMNNPAAAAPYFEKAVAVHLLNSKETNPDVQWVSNLQRAYRNHAIALAQLDDSEAALQAARKAYDSSLNFAALYPDHPATPRIQAEGLTALLDQLVKSDPQAALARAKEALTASMQSAVRRKEAPEIHGAVGEARDFLAQIHLKLGDLHNALIESQKASYTWQHKLDLEEKNGNHRLLLANQQLLTATILTHLNRHEEARQNALTAQFHFQQLLKDNLNHPPAAEGLKSASEIIDHPRSPF